MTTSSSRPVNRPSRELLPAEQELLQIYREMRADEGRFIARERELTDEAEYKKLMAEAPGIAYVPRFVDFERRHHGSHAGLMAARLVLLKAGARYVGLPPILWRTRSCSRAFDKATS